MSKVYFSLFELYKSLHNNHQAAQMMKKLTQEFPEHFFKYYRYGICRMNLKQAR